MALPSAVASLLSPPPPPERDTPRVRTAAAEGFVEGFAAEGAAEAAVEEEASASSAAGVLLSLAAAPLHPASSPPSPPALQSTPATPPLPLLSPRSRSSSARLGALAPVQLSLALLVVFAARLSEFSINPAGLLAAAGFAVLALANLAQASPRFVARAMALLIMCCPTLRLVSVLVRSPEEMARDLDKFAGAGCCLLTFCAACGAAFGALPPSALPPTRKLLAVGYCACVQMCVALILRVRAGDERALSFYLLRLLLPFLASFFAAQAASGRSLGQHAPPLPLGGACSRSPNRSLSRRHPEGAA